VRLVFPLIAFFCTSCARSWVNYPPQIVPGGIDENGRWRDGKVIAARAAEFNGSDLIGGTVINVTRGGVHIAAEGGVNNSISTAEGYRTARYGIGATAIVATTGILAGQAANAYGAHQATQQANARAAAAAAAKPAPLPSVGSTIPAQTQAVVTPVP
jgi:hypothetical protein